MANKFNDLYDVNALQQNLDEIEANKNKKDGDFPEVPVGKYEVKIEKIELGESKNGSPMGKIMFRIIEGEFKKSCLFYNQVLVGKDKNTGEVTAFGLHNFNEFLKTLDSQVEIKFKDFFQYEQLLLDVAEAVESLVYEIQYGKNNDFPTFKVLNIYED